MVQSEKLKLPKGKPLKLQAKILLILAPIAVIPILLMGWVTYSEIASKTREYALQALDVLSSEEAKNLKLRIEETENVAQMLVNSKILRKFTESNNIYEKYNVLMPNLAEIFEHYRQVYPEIILIRIRNTSGSDIMIIPTENESASKQIKIDTTSLHRDTTSFFYPDDKHPLFIHTRKIYYGDLSSGINKSLFGYLDIISSIDVIDTAIEKALTEKFGIIFFTDKLGNVLRDASDLGLGEELDLPKVEEMIKDNIKKSPKEIQYHGTKATLHKQKISDNLYMFSMLPSKLIMESSRDYFYRMSGVVGITIFLFAALGFLIIKYVLVKPLQQLGNAAQEIGKGNLGFNIDINKRDELGELAASLKEMSRNLRQSNEQIRYFAYHDSLTKLPNRLMFGEYLNHALAHARRHKQSLALMYLDLDDFKVINDTLGHHAGDTVLRELSERLAQCLRADDYLSRPSTSRSETETVARLGGDEFIIFLPNINSPYEAATVANRVLEALSIPFHVDNHDLHVSASIGITTYPKDGLDAETLIRNADMAMYHAKEKGKNAYSYYQESMNIAAFERLNLQNEMRQALIRNEFVLHYQPQLDLKSGKIVSVEALIRWNHPEKGLISPDRFIPIAEQSELIVSIGEWVLMEACRQIKAWHDEGFTELCVSVNASAAQLHRHDLKEVIQDALLSNVLPAHALEIELTETAISSSEELVTETLTAIKELGVRIAMDDFGTGYSSLSYLSKLPIDKIKVDRSFVQDITPETTSAPIISAILAMATSLELPVTAEGVELQAQIDFLKDRGCGLIQGFLISQPLPAKDVTELLKKKKVLKEQPHLAI